MCVRHQLFAEMPSLGLKFILPIVCTLLWNNSSVEFKDHTSGVLAQLCVSIIDGSSSRLNYALAESPSCCSVSSSKMHQACWIFLFLVQKFMFDILLMQWGIISTSFCYFSSWLLFQNIKLLLQCYGFNNIFRNWCMWTCSTCVYAALFQLLPKRHLDNLFLFGFKNLNQQE